MDEVWLAQILHEVIRKDELAGVLWDVHLRAKGVRELRKGGEGVGRRLEMSIARSDYMVSVCERGGVSEGETLQLKQVEVNSIACAGACHGNRVADMHRHFARTGAYDGEDDVSEMESLEKNLNNTSLDNAESISTKSLARPTIYSPEDNLPPNTTLTCLVNALVVAYTAYNDLFYPLQHAPLTTTSPPSSRPPTCILLLTQPRNINPSDELPFSTALWSHNPPIPTFHVTFPSPAILTDTSLDPNTGALHYMPGRGKAGGAAKKYEVAVVYWRAGFQPHEYTDLGVEARVRFESSRAVLCPSIPGQLAGSKIVQVALTQRDQLAHFIADESVITNLARTCMPMQLLGSPQGRQLMAALKRGDVDSNDWILKPAMAEGGGHNISGAKMIEVLREVEEDELVGGLLMKRIVAPEGVLNTLAMGTGRLYQGDVIAELGVWGTYLFSRSDAGEGGNKGDVEMLRNEVAGWSVRTKPASVDEMSVVKGYGAFDSVVLIEDDDFWRSCKVNIRDGTGAGRDT